jgi:hypothetical protein
VRPARRRPGPGLRAAAALLAAAGCIPASNGGGEAPVTDERLIMAGVVDEADALAWSGQVELSALGHLLTPLRPDFRPAPPLPTPGQLRTEPAGHRGAWVVLSGKLVSAARYRPRDESPPIGELHRGLVLLPDGGLVAFATPTELPRQARRAPDPNDYSVKMPKVGRAVGVTGRFLKRWVALDGRGKDYLVMPFLAAHSVTELAGEEAEKLARARMPLGTLPLQEIPAPEVWSRPIVELGRGGALSLDGRPITWKRLQEELYPLAARDRNPLGDSALAVVCLVDPTAPAPARERLKRLPATMGARCIFRLRRPEAD